jgi:hypothetical protein
MARSGTEVVDDASSSPRRRGFAIATRVFCGRRGRAAVFHYPWSFATLASMGLRVPCR